MLMVLYFSILTRDKGEQVSMGMGLGLDRAAMNDCSLLSVPGIVSGLNLTIKQTYIAWSRKQQQPGQI